MRTAEYNEKFQVDYTSEITYDALKRALSYLKGFYIDRFDDILKTLYLKTGSSWCSFGEKITITVTSCENGKSIISILSVSKLGLYDCGKNRKNTNIIMSAVSKELKGYSSETVKVASAGLTGSRIKKTTKGKGKGNIIAIGIIILIIIGTIGFKMSNPNNSSVISNSNSKSTSQKKEQSATKVGDVIKTKKFEFVVTSIKERSKVGNKFFEKSPSKGGTYITVQFQYTNITDKPIGTFSFPAFKLIDKSGTMYNSDIDATGHFATELNLDEKVLSDLNPGITVKGAEVFEISKDSFKKGGWEFRINADKTVDVFIN